MFELYTFRELRRPNLYAASDWKTWIVWRDERNIHADSLQTNWLAQRHIGGLGLVGLGGTSEPGNSEEFVVQNKFDLFPS